MQLISPLFDPNTPEKELLYWHLGIVPIEDLGKMYLAIFHRKVYTILGINYHGLYELLALWKTQHFKHYNSILEKHPFFLDPKNVYNQYSNHYTVYECSQELYINMLQSMDHVPILKTSMDPKVPLPLPYGPRKELIIKEQDPAIQPRGLGDFMSSTCKKIGEKYKPYPPPRNEVRQSYIDPSLRYQSHYEPDPYEPRYQNRIQNQPYDPKTARYGPIMTQYLNSQYK
jgi:hypothetical protein